MLWFTGTMSEYRNDYTSVYDLPLASFNYKGITGGLNTTLYFQINLALIFILTA